MSLLNRKQTMEAQINNIIVYTKNNCIYCNKAKALLKGRGYSFKEKNFETEFKNIEELFKELGKTVRAMPQIKINGDLIGGYNQLVEYFEKQKLVNFRGEIL